MKLLHNSCGSMLAVILAAGLLAERLSMARQDSPAAPTPQVGQAAPPLQLERLLQAPQGAVASWETLRGKVVVLEFWATWCGPCIAAIPHLNELAESMRERPVQFIAITDEESDKVERFLVKRRMSAWLALDRDHLTFSAYGVRAIPHTVVVDSTCRVALVTSPTHLTVENLEGVIAGRPIASPATTKAASAPPAAAAPVEAPLRPLVRIEITPTEEIYGGWSMRPRKFEARAIPLRTALAMIHGLPSPSRIVSSRPIPDQHYDIHAVVPKGQEARLQTMLHEAIDAALGCRSAVEQREVEVLILTAPRPPGPDLRATKATDEPSRGSTDEGIIVGSNSGIENLVSELEAALETPLIDETGLTGRFDWDVQFTAGDLASLERAIREQMGLTLERQQRRIPVLVIEWPEAPAVAPG